MFNPVKVISLVITLIFVAGCGANQATAVLIASRPPEQPVEVAQDNTGEDAVLPQIPLNLSGSTLQSSETAPDITIPEEILSDRATIPLVENEVISDKRIDLEGNRESETVPMIEDQSDWSEQLPEHSRWQQTAVPMQENEASAALIDKPGLSPLTHWEQRWLVGGRSD
jgi:hypothetical protein